MQARILALVAAAALAVGCFLVLRPFLSALLWAVILVFCTWPLFARLIRWGLPRGLAAAVMVLAAFLVLVLPLIYATPGRAEMEALAARIEALLAGGLPDLSPILAGLPLIGEQAVEWWQSLSGEAGTIASLLRPHAGAIAQAALSLLVSVLSGIAEMLIAILLAFFIYRDGSTLAAYGAGMMQRLAGPRGAHILELTANVTRGVVYGLIGTAIVQGIMTAFGLWLAGVPHAVLLGVVAGLISVLPVGAPLVWLPASLWLLGQGEWGWALFLLLYGALGISSVDNIIRPWFISRGADLPLLLTLIGALGGVLAFGFLGLFLGPVLLAVGFSLIKDWAEGGMDIPSAPRGG
ncbi:MAG: AI-2E family transporter [Rhodovarius sp.]|nr:AI-2E family transporter [Rhodovarius sp.]